MNISYKWKALIVCIAGTFMVLLDTTIVNVALPPILATFNENLDKAQLVISGYLISLALIIPATGFLSDRIGIKRIYLISLTGFLLGSFLCGLAWDINSLTIFRFIQGFGGGLLMPLAMTIIFMTVPRKEQGFVMSIFGLPLLLAPTIGPTIGGYLIEKFDWRIIFYMNIPVGIVAIWLTLIWLRESPQKSALPFDYKGFLLAGLSFVPSLLALSRAPSWGWNAPLTITMLAVSAVSMVFWVFVELKEKYPLLDLRIFKNRIYSISTLVNFATTFGLFSAIFLFPLFLQNLKGLGPMETGILLIPQGLGTLVAMPLSGRLYDRIGARILVIVGLVIVAAATLQLRFLDLNTSNAELSFILVLRGAGMGFAMMPVITAGMAAVPLEQTSSASAVTNVARQVFASFGTAIFATVLDGRQKFHFGTLSQTVNQHSITTIGVLSGIQRAFLHGGLTFEQARQVAVLSLYRFTQLRASVQAFEDAFILSSIVLLAGIIPALFLPSGPPVKKEKLVYTE